MASTEPPSRRASRPCQSRPSSPSTVTVSLRAIRENTRRMRARCGVPVMAVVKASGFGLGAVDTARAALDGGATELGVATCDEALALREGGIESPILAWLLHDGAPIREAVAAGIRLAPTDATQISTIAGIADELGVVAEVELEIESGMHRSGCDEPEWAALFTAAADAEQAGQLRVVGVWTHLSGSAPEHFTEPLATLDRAVEAATAAGLSPRRHAAASLAASIDQRTRLDIVRLGASLLGIEPVRDDPLGLLPVARWESTIVRLHAAPAGSVVGYGRDTLTDPTTLALIPVGYADGLARRASPGLGVSVAGEVRPFIGRISMDHAVIDVGSLPVTTGEQVVLIGDPDRGELGLADWADALSTIEQEVLIALGPRVARIIEEETPCVASS